MIESSFQTKLSPTQPALVAVEIVKMKLTMVMKKITLLEMSPKAILSSADLFPR